jgi:PhzF family phenazine biosynthesis protein
LALPGNVGYDLVLAQRDDVGGTAALSETHRKLLLYQVDAFTSRVFGGNPAAVVPLDAWLAEEQLQAIAAENNLSETAYFVPLPDDRFHLRWFTPVNEVPLCGHATLASAHVILNLMQPRRESVRFETLSGELVVARREDQLAMDFPRRTPEPCTPPPELAPALGALPEQVLKTPKGKDPNYYAVYPDEATVLGIRPDMALLGKMDAGGVCITAPGMTSDFVSRYFAPAFGVPEDPVTGSTHCALIPYWAQRLGRQKMFARQVSARGGELHCELRGERVSIAGNAVLYLTGEILV